MLLQQLWHIVQARRIRRELTDFAPLATGQCSGRRLAALFVRADQRNRQHIAAQRVRILIIEIVRRVWIHGIVAPFRL